MNARRNPVHIPSVAVGTRVEGMFLVLEINVRSRPDGDPFTILMLGNSTGRIGTEPFWAERQPEIAGLQPGHVIQVAGEVQTYRERRQLHVTSLTHVPKDEVDPSELLPSIGPVDRYWQTLDGWRREMTKPRLKAVVDTFYRVNKLLADPKEGDETLVALGAKFSSLGLEDMKKVVEQTQFYKTPEDALKLFEGEKFRKDTMPKVVDFCVSHGIVDQKPTVGFDDAKTQLSFDTEVLVKAKEKK